MACSRGGDTFDNVSASLIAEICGYLRTYTSYSRAGEREFAHHLRY